MNYKEIDIFDLLYETFKIDKNRPLRLFEAFSGMGTHTTAVACEKLGIKWLGIELDKETRQFGIDRVYNYFGKLEKVSKQDSYNLFNFE